MSNWNGDSQLQRNTAKNNLLTLIRLLRQIRSDLRAL